MTSTGPIPPAAAPAAPPPTPARPALRRSSTDRYAAGVCGGLAEFFGIDPVIFRVLFVATSFVGGIGVVAYLAAWLSIPESDEPNSPLDRWVASLRKQDVPLWVVVASFALLLWIGLFSWWTPFHAAPIVVIAAVLTIAVIALRHRNGDDQHGDVTRPASVTTLDAPAVSLTKPADVQSVDADLLSEPATDTTAVLPPAPALPPAGLPPAGLPPAVLPPATEQLREWWAHDQAARYGVTRRGRITEIVAHSVLFTVWFVLAMIAFSTPIPVQAFLWSGFAILLAAVFVGAIVRRPRWRLLVGVGFLAAALIVVGNYTVRLGDPTGQRELQPTTVAEIDARYPMLAGEQLLDFSAVNFDGETVEVTIEQGAGHIRVTVPDDVNVVIDARGRVGELTVFGNTYDGVQNRHEDSYAANPASSTAGTLRLTISLAAGQVEVVRA